MGTPASLNEERFKLSSNKFLVHHEYAWLSAGNRTQRMGKYLSVWWMNHGEITKGVKVSVRLWAVKQVSAYSSLWWLHILDTFYSKTLCHHTAAPPSLCSVLPQFHLPTATYHPASSSVTSFLVHMTFYLAPQTDTSNFPEDSFLF